MLPILLGILKIAGIVLLVLLGLICVVVFTVLVVPVRYRLSGSYCEAVKANVCVTWLLRAVSVAVTYEKDLDISVRILGFKLFKEKGGHGATASEEETDQLLPQPPDEADTFLEEEPDVWEDLENGPECGDIPHQASRDDSSPRKQKKKDGQKDSGKAEGKPGLALDSLKGKWNHLKDQKERLEAFLKDQSNRQTFKLIVRQLKKLIRHMLPTKVQGKAVIGFEDPAATGKVLSGLGLLYAWYGDNIDITPVFDQAVLEVEGSVKGRVRAGTILLCGVRVLLNKNFRRLVRKFMKSGGI